MKWSKAKDQALRTYILLFAGLGLSFGLYRQNSSLGPWWTILIAAMLGLTSLIDRIATMFGNSTKGDSDEYKSKKTDATKTGGYVDRREGDDDIDRDFRRIRGYRPGAILRFLKRKSCRQSRGIGEEELGFAASGLRWRH